LMAPSSGQLPPSNPVNLGSRLEPVGGVVVAHAVGGFQPAPDWGMVPVALGQAPLSPGLPPRGTSSADF
jgi:hypothetical protein